MEYKRLAVSFISLSYFILGSVILSRQIVRFIDSIQKEKKVSSNLLFFVLFVLGLWLHSVRSLVF